MNLVPKTWLEKLGDYLSRPLHRFIFSVITIIPFFVFALFNVLSIIPSVRVRFVENVMVPGKDGKLIPCAIVKVKHHAYMPIIPIVCFFFYVPYQVEYYLVHNISLQGKAPKSAVSEGLLRVCTKTRITSGTAAMIQKNPALVTDALVAELAQAKNTFLEDIQPFIDAKVLRITEETDSFTVCRFPDNDVLISHYAKHMDAPMVSCFSERELPQYLQNPNTLYHTYASGAFSVLSLNPKTLERLITICNDMQQNSEEAAVPVTPEPLPESVNQHIENNKKPLDMARVEKDLNYKAASGKKTSAYIYAFLALMVVEFTIFSFALAIFVVGVIGTIPSFLLIRTSIRKFKLAKANKAKLEKKEYKIIKVRCTQSDSVTHESDDGDYTTYTMGFENGYTFNPPQKLGIVGDWFFLVYLAGENKPTTMYNAIEYRAESDLTFEIFTK